MEGDQEHGQRVLGLNKASSRVARVNCRGSKGSSSNNSRGVSMSARAMHLHPTGQLMGALVGMARVPRASMVPSPCVRSFERRR